MSLKQRKIFVNSKICNDSIVNESYKISIELEQNGSKSVLSKSIEIKKNQWERLLPDSTEAELILSSNINHQNTKSI